MRAKVTWKRFLAIICDRLRLIVVGGWLALDYINLNHLNYYISFRHVHAGLKLGFWLLTMGMRAFTPRKINSLMTRLPAGAGRSSF